MSCGLASLDARPYCPGEMPGFFLSGILDNGLALADDARVSGLVILKCFSVDADRSNPSDTRGAHRRAAEPAAPTKLPSPGWRKPSGVFCFCPTRAIAWTSVSRLGIARKCRRAVPVRQGEDSGTRT